MGLAVLALSWIVGTSVAASAHDPDLVAATDGSRLLLTHDGGYSWHRVPFPVLTRIHSLAFLGRDLVASTARGLMAVPGPKSPPAIRSRLHLDAVASAGDSLWGTDGGFLLLSKDGGFQFQPVAALPEAPVHGLAVSGRRVVIVAASGMWARTPSGWRVIDPRADWTIAASPEGTFYRLSSDGLQKSIRQDEWQLVATVGGRALAIGASATWISTGRGVMRLGELLQGHKPGEPRSDLEPMRELAKPPASNLASPRLAAAFRRLSSAGSRSSESSSER
ncbi:MAG: hypothetical protein HY698_01270 [Deltaproteobacteria bacterium]|nr:hypothetical protein [Deltaproteobacteria bacterium]